MSYTIFIIATTVLISLAAFNNEQIKNKLILFPYGMDRPSEYYRVLTSGFIHQDIPHLLFNMYALYIFGEYMEAQFAEISFRWMYIVLYVTGIIVASIPALIKHKNHSYYSALGASGGVSAIVFAFIYFNPWARMGLLFLPIRIPAIIFAVLYLLYSVYSSRAGKDNIGHDAHMMGRLYGFLFAYLVDPTHGRMFIESIQNFR